MTPTPVATPLVTDWISSVSSLVGGVTGIIAAGFAIASFVIAYKADRATKAVATREAETRQLAADGIQAAVRSWPDLRPSDARPKDEGRVDVDVHPPTMEIDLSDVLRRLRDEPLDGGSA